MPPEFVIFMKVGTHGDEGIDKIIEDKTSQERQFGSTWWGYGGTLCHPLRQVQPFVNEAEREGCSVHCIFLPTRSPFGGGGAAATRYSVDDATWHPVPNGLTVTASKYALVCQELERHDATYDLAAYQVAEGSRRGKPLDDYLSGHVDKACARLRPSGRTPFERPACLHAVLAPPYAVLLRT